MLLECAIGRYPYGGASSYIEAAEAIVCSPPPVLPPDVAGSFSAEFSQLLASCLAKEAEARLPADILLGSPWFARHGIADLGDAIAGVRAWLASLPESAELPLPVVVPAPPPLAAEPGAARQEPRKSEAAPRTTDIYIYILSI